jgi:hypothetical protein
MTVAAAVAAILCTVPIAVAAPNTGEGLSPSATGAAAGQPWRQVRKGEGLMSISRGVAASHDVSLAQAMVGCVCRTAIPCAPLPTTMRSAR